MDIRTAISTQKNALMGLLSPEEQSSGEILYNNGHCQALSWSAMRYDLIVNTETKLGAIECGIFVNSDGGLAPSINGHPANWNRITYACILQIEHELRLADPKESIEHKKYTRAGMIQRVLKERAERAANANYSIQWADNIYGDHILTNERGVKYKVFLRDFEKKTGYSDSLDAQLNKLGTTKHIMFAFKELNRFGSLYERMDKTFPFIEIFCDPLNDYRISWYYPDALTSDEQGLLAQYFNASRYVGEEHITDLLGFLRAVRDNPRFCVRPEVAEKTEAAFEKKAMETLHRSWTPDFSSIKTTLYPYQQEGIAFALFRKTAIIADEMGLGKTVQAIGTALLKKQLFGFRRAMVVCPASLKAQWKAEIEKFSDETALIVQGTPDEREAQYSTGDCYFVLLNYETVIRDCELINRAGVDLLILDEVQRARNYETSTATALKQIQTKHKLALTGTPIENRLIDIFSIMSILDATFLGPLWEFSYQHCLFDPEKYNKINGYYNLQALNRQLEDILIRREKKKVAAQLPDVVQIEVPIEMAPLQAEYHASYTRTLAQIVGKKYLTAFDVQRLQVLLTNMRMVCDSTYLIDEQTNVSPKLDELKNILFDKLDIVHKDVKIIIFSEWLKVHKLIGKLLRDHSVGYVELNGSIPVAARSGLIAKFESGPQYKVFLATEAGGVGLNLQVADTLINFELPWNPARKNQRLGRIDRIGQQNSKLTVFNFVTCNSVEQQIARGLLVKQSLFDGVLSSESNTDFVDFSSKGRSQFIGQLEMFVAESQEWAGLAPPPQSAPPELPAHDEINMLGEADEPALEPESTTPPPAEQPQSARIDELQKIMTSGLDFLSGLLKMATGHAATLENQTVNIDPDSGEVTLKFKVKKD
ncbi:MAG: DEAD/DEAH box helicase [Bacteroidales bacterium]|jgi:SNF2 family DNA or RNA helicase|nr:DEAD/DEAH box helicase [Bacteroidales bacterium]